MRTILTIAMIGLFVCGAARAEREYTFDKKDNFDGAAVSAITIDIVRGDIAIEKSRGQEIEVFYKNAVMADNQKEAEEINEEYKYSAKVDGNRLIVAIDEPRRHRHSRGIVERIIEGDWSREGTYPMVKLSIPDGKAVEVLSSSSDIDVSDLKLDLDVESSSSDVTLENTQGNFTCDVSSGDITVTGHKGEISAKGKSSDIRLTDIEGPIDASTASGDVDIEKATGVVDASTASGDARLTDISGDIDVRAASGDIRVSSAAAAVRASAVSGDVHLDGLSAREGDYDVQSVSGDIIMEVSRDFTGEVMVRSVSGSVNSQISDDLDIESDSRIEGSIGKGAGRLSATTTSGDITIDRY
jgi:hypothetical protein